MRLRGPHLIGQANLNTADLSQSGAISSFNLVIIPHNGWSFGMDIIGEAAGVVINSIPMVGVPPLTADRDNAREVIINPNIGFRDYAAEWRQVNP